MVARRMIDFPSMGWQHPLAEMERMARRMNGVTRDLFGSPRMPLGASKAFPAVNISEGREHYHVRAELPGIKAENLKLEVVGESLSISGERGLPSRSDNPRYHRREREAGRFSRIVHLPGEVDADSVEAKLTDGLLTVTIAKADAAKPRKIIVKSS